MKILLINPPQTFYPGSAAVVVGLPLGIMYLAAMLDRNGYEVKILDTLVPDSLPISDGDAKQYGMPWEEIRQEIQQSRPDIVGITCPFTTQIGNATRISEIVKDIDAGILTVLGGPHTSVRATQLLEEAKNVDIAVIGEGEYTILDLVRYLEGNKKISEINGIAYRRGEQVVLNPKREFIGSLDELPFPAYHLVDMEEYLKPRRIQYRCPQSLREISMITSRGCPYNCVFCSIHLHMGKIWRAHSEQYVVKHIEHVINNYGVEHIHFEDDNLTLDVKRFEGILDRIIQKGIKFSWDTPNGIRADRLTKDLLKKIKETGCTNLIIGVESGDQFILDNVIGKHLRLDGVINTARMCKELGIPLSAFYVIGFPSEKKENIKQTIDLALRLKREFAVHMYLFVATPLYGTRLYDICIERGYLTRELTPRALSEATQVNGAGLIQTEDFTADEIKEIALSAVAAHERLTMFSYIKNPWTTLRAIRRNPRGFAGFVKWAMRL